MSNVVQSTGKKFILFENGTDMSRMEKTAKVEHAFEVLGLVYSDTTVLEYTPHTHVWAATETVEMVEHYIAMFNTQPYCHTVFYCNDVIFETAVRVAIREGRLNENDFVKVHASIEEGRPQFYLSYFKQDGSMTPIPPMTAAMVYESLLMKLL